MGQTLGASLDPARRFDRAISWVAALACLTLALGLFDVMLLPVSLAARAPELPAELGKHDAKLLVKVTNASKRPVAGAEVRVFWLHEDRFYSAGTGQTDAGGKLRLPQLPRGAVWVVVDAPGYARQSAQLVLGENERSLSFVLVPEHRLRVTVRDDAGKPVNLATVLVTGSDPLPFGALTDSNGKVIIGRLGAPPWAVKVSARGFETVTRSDVVADLSVVLRRLGALEVTVLDPEGKPASGATVLIAGSTLWPARHMETDGRGIANIVGLLAGVYDLKARRGKLVSDTWIGLELARGEHRSITLKLTVGRMITALVTDGEDDNAPVVPSADVVLVEGGLSSFPLRGRTGPEGTVTLGPIASGLAALAAHARDFVPRSAVPVPPVPEGPVRIALLRGAILRGEVVDSRGFPVDGASIEVIGTDLFGLPVAQTPLLMNFGRANFEWSLSSALPLIPMGELGVVPGPVPPIPRGSGMVGEPVSALALADNIPLPDWNLDVEDPVEQWVTHADGTFVAHPVAPGRVRALVRHPDYVEGLSRVLTLGPGGEGSVKVVLFAGGALEGRLLDDRDFPVPGARIDVSASKGTFERSTLTASDGSFAFAAVPSEVVVSLARPDDLSRIVLRRVLQVEEAGRTEIELRLPELREAAEVRVVDEHGDPVRAAEVTLLSLNPEVPFRRTRFTDDAGSVHFEDAQGLPVRVLVEAPGFARLARKEAKLVAELKIELAHGVLVEGRVTAIGGRSPVPGASVTLVADGLRSYAITDEFGGFTVRDVAPGTVLIQVSHPDYAEVEFNAEVKSTGRADRPLELQPVDLVEAGQVEGEVTDEHGDPVMGARVSVGIAPAYLPSGALPAGLATTNSRGRFKLGGLNPGNIRLQAYAAGVGRGEVRGVEVTAGRTTSGVQIRLSREIGDDSAPPKASLAVTLSQQGSQITIVQVAPGSEAERGGLRVSDRIVSIGGAPPSSLEDARERMSGPMGSDAVMVVERGSERIELSIAREPVRQ